MTGAAERLSLPMEHTFVYQRRNGKLFSEFGLSIDDVIQGGLDDIKAMVQFHSDWESEVQRRQLDAEELEEIKTLLPGEKLVTFLPIPDDVREGRTSISGYDRKRMRMLVRVAECGQNNDVAITSFSLDRSHYSSIQAAALAVDQVIPDGLSSNEITADRVHKTNDSRTSEELVELIRTAYDKQLTQEFGGA